MATCILPLGVMAGFKCSVAGFNDFLNIFLNGFVNGFLILPIAHRKSSFAGSLVLF